MEDKVITGNILTLIKSLCNLLNHGVIESPNNNKVLMEVLNTYLELQHKVYTYMTNEGWYVLENVEEQKIEKAKQKFAV